MGECMMGGREDGGGGGEQSCAALYGSAVPPNPKRPNVTSYSYVAREAAWSLLLVLQPLPPQTTMLPQRRAPSPVEAYRILCAFIAKPTPASHPHSSRTPTAPTVCFPDALHGFSRFAYPHCPQAPPPSGASCPTPPSAAAGAPSPSRCSSPSTPPCAPPSPSTTPPPTPAAGSSPPASAAPSSPPRTWAPPPRSAAPPPPSPPAARSPPP